MPPQQLARTFYPLCLAVLLPLAACDAGEACEWSLLDEEAFALCMNADAHDFMLEDEAPTPDDGTDDDDDDLRCKPSGISIPGMKYDPTSLPISCDPPPHPAKP